MKTRATDRTATTTLEDLRNAQEQQLINSNKKANSEPSSTTSQYEDGQQTMCNKTPGEDIKQSQDGRSNKTEEIKDRKEHNRGVIANEIIHLQPQKLVPLAQGGIPGDIVKFKIPPPQDRHVIYRSTKTRIHVEPNIKVGVQFQIEH